MPPLPTPARAGRRTAPHPRSGGASVPVGEATVRAVRPGQLVAAGRIDADTAARLRAALLTAIGHSLPGATVTVDLAEAVGCADAGLAVLREAQQAARARGVELRLVKPEPVVRYAMGLVDVGGWHIAAG